MRENDEIKRTSGFPAMFAQGRGFPPANIEAYVIFCLLCLVTFLGITDNYLFNDDFLWLGEARYGMERHNLLTYRVIDFFRPAINASFYVMERTAPGNIPLHYSINLILHFLNCVLVYHLVLLLLRSRNKALAAAVIFAVSSVHAAAVLWISARTTLISVLFVHLSLISFASHTGRRGTRVILSTIFLVLALAAKETAITGLALLAAVWWYQRSAEHERSLSPLSLVPPSIVSLLYLVARKAVMGGFVRENWGPGWHALRNIAGGFLYSLYPWPFLSLFKLKGRVIREPAHPFLPEILAVPIVILLVWIAGRLNKSKEFTLAILWALLALVPASLFRYRFFSTESITQNRYYYLSSVGSILLITMLLAALWNGRSRARRIAAAALFVVVCAGYMVRIDRIEKKWDLFTKQNARVIEVLIEETDKHPEITTVAVEDAPLPLRYLSNGIRLERPRLELVEISGGREAAESCKPCLYVHASGDKRKVLRFEKIE